MEEVVLQRGQSPGLVSNPPVRPVRPDCYTIFWVFLITACLGALLETAFMLLTRGQLQNRSGVLYGPFSLVWGLGGVLFTLCFHRLAGQRSLRVFLAGALLGAAYEYGCSWAQEFFLGACFWDYSHLPFNFQGRVSLLFAVFWGAAAVVWTAELYPLLSRWIAPLAGRRGRQSARVLAVFMVLNIALSAAALGRMDQRQQGIPPQGAVAAFLDQRWPDQRLYQIYSNLVYIGTPETKAAAGVTSPPIRSFTPAEQR